MSDKAFSKDVLTLDCAAETEKIVARMRELVKKFRRRGLIVALSGGIDSSVTAALCVRAVGKEKVFGLHMPEKDSAEETVKLSQVISTHYEFDSTIEDITHILEAVGCYRRRDDAIRAVIPAYGPGWKNKIVLPNVVENKGYNFYSVVAQAPDGEMVKARLPLEAYLGILSASNFKQRFR